MIKFQITHMYKHCIHINRSNGSILHNLVTVSQRPASGYTLNNVSSTVLYKIIHYFMENPINEKTVLKYPVSDIDVSTIIDIIMHTNIHYTCTCTYMYMCTHLCTKFNVKSIHVHTQ